MMIHVQTNKIKLKKPNMMIQPFDKFIQENENLNENNLETVSDKFWFDFNNLCKKYHLKDVTIEKLNEVMTEVLNNPDYL